MAPSAEMLPAFLSALAMPLFFSHSMAFSTSPPQFWSAFLVSMMPAPDMVRSSLTCAAEMATLGASSFFGSSLASALGSSLGFSGSAPPSALYLASSFSTPAAKSSSLFCRPSPRSRRTKRRITRFSPILEMVSFSTCSTVLSSSLSHFWPMRAISSNCFFRRPMTIFSAISSGLPFRSSFSISMAFSAAMVASGTSLAETATTEGLAAICMATSAANSLKMALMATKSVSLLISQITPIFWLKCT
mmetsp:Transcript_31004/g.92104  ORF Transcript_31004/g.92104 Transcript_31004/m.92104 type:complete len:246 (+) Transcript_31004:341-1078(+)